MLGTSQRKLTQAAAEISQSAPTRRSALPPPPSSPEGRHPVQGEPPDSLGTRVTRQSDTCDRGERSCTGLTGSGGSSRRPASAIAGRHHSPASAQCQERPGLFCCSDFHAAKRGRFGAERSSALWALAMIVCVRGDCTCRVKPLHTFGKPLHGSGISSSHSLTKGEFSGTYKTIRRFVHALSIF